jgi:hypothetical protein
MSDYWLGVATLPALGLALIATAYAWNCATEFLEARWGVTADVKIRRRVDEISDYTLRNNIWWERSFGPVFAGGWYREHGWPWQFTRWIGIGSVDGPCVVIYRKRAGDFPTRRDVD